jgi:hypothetical protein
LSVLEATTGDGSHASKSRGLSAPATRVRPKLPRRRRASGEEPTAARKANDETSVSTRRTSLAEFPRPKVPTRGSALLGSARAPRCGPIPRSLQQRSTTVDRAPGLQPNPCFESLFVATTLVGLPEPKAPEELECKDQYVWPKSRRNRSTQRQGPRYRGTRTLVELVQGARSRKATTTAMSPTVRSPVRPTRLDATAEAAGDLSHTKEEPTDRLAPER